MNIPDLLSRCRKDTGLSLRQLSIKSGVPASTISFYELGRVEPTLYRLDALLKALNQSIVIGKGSDIPNK